jgi:protein O-mannosyl-transferase
MPLYRNGTPPPANAYYAWGVCGLLALAVWLIYGQTLDHGFLDLDDSGFVYANHHVTPGLTAEGIKWAFTDGPYGEWYPLAPLSHMLDCQLFGLNARGHHLTSLLLHAAASIALFLVWWRMTDELLASAFVAAVFAVHPQHVESVAWVAERRDVLSGLFLMLTLAAYLGYVRHGRRPGRYCLVAAMLALGLMAKPMLVTVPALLLLLDYWPLARIGAAQDAPAWTRAIERPGTARIVLEKLPLFALSAADCLMTLRTHNHPTVPWTWSVRIGNAAVSCVTYVVQVFWPVDLTAFYPMPTGGQPTWKVAGGMTILALVSAAAVIWRRRCPYVFVGWFWYLGMLFPVLGLIGVSDHAMADRYMYLPGIGLYAAVAWGAARLCAGSPTGRRMLVGGAGLVIAGLLACATWQTSFWRDEVALWGHALTCDPDNYRAELGLAGALAQNDRFDEAIAYYRRAEEHAVDAGALTGLGTLLLRQGKVDEAVAQLRQAVARFPDNSLAQLNLGAALSRQGQFDEARQHLQRAIEINPRQSTGHVAMAHLLIRQNKFDDAREELERAVAIDPYSAAARNDLGSILVNLGKTEDAITQFQTALDLEPDSVLAHTNLALALARLGRTGEALAHYRRALQLDPNNLDALQALGAVRP